VNPKTDATKDIFIICIFNFAVSIFTATIFWKTYELTGFVDKNLSVLHPLSFLCIESLYSIYWESNTFLKGAECLF